MSVTVNNLAPATGSEIAFNASDVLQHSGKVIQTITTTLHTRTTVTASNSGNGTNLNAGLNLVITPKFADSTIWLRWTIFYEVHHDTMFLVQRNSSLIGYNLDRGNVRWSGIVTPKYDNDYSTTPQTNTINWFDKPGGTSAYTYSICTRSSSGGNYTFALNRPNNSAGTDGQEVGVSHGIAREICA